MRNHPNGESWQSYAAAIRELAEVAHQGRSDNHAIAEALRDSAATIEELANRVDIAETWIAGTGRFEEFDRLASVIEKRWRAK